MAEIALGSVERIFKVGTKIKEAVKTVQQNEEECQEVQQEVAILMDYLSRLRVMEATNQQGMNGALMGLERALDRALKLVTNCQERHTILRFLRRLLTARDMARKLVQVQDDILRKVSICNLAISVEYYSYTVTVPRSGAHHLPIAQLQDAGKVDISYNSLTTGHSGSGADSEIIMSATGSVVPCAPLSGITEITQLEATRQHFLGENINEGGRSQVYMMQKIVLKISMPCDKSRSKAMALIARADGVSSLAITGDGKDMVEVGPRCGRRLPCGLPAQEAGPRDHPARGDVKAKEAPPVVVMNTEEASPAAEKPANRRRHARSSGIRSIITKLSKFMRPRALLVEHTDHPTPGGPGSRFFSVTSPSTAVSAASPSAWLLPLQPACVQDHARNPSASPRRDLSSAADPPPLPERLAPVRRSGHTSNMPRVRRSAWLPSKRRLPSTDDEAGGVRIPVEEAPATEAKVKMEDDGALSDEEYFSADETLEVEIRDAVSCC